MLAALEKGLPLSAAAKVAGVGRQTVYDWKNSDPAFAAALLEAEEVGVEHLEALIRSHAIKDWRAGAHLLAVKRPTVWGRHSNCPECQKRRAEEESDPNSDRQHIQAMLDSMGWKLVSIETGETVTLGDTECPTPKLPGIDY